MTSFKRHVAKMLAASFCLFRQYNILILANFESCNSVVELFKQKFRLVLVTSSLLCKIPRGLSITCIFTCFHAMIHRYLPIFQMLYAAEALEASVDHDGDAAAESLTLLHTVGRQHHRPPVLHDVVDTVPQEPTGLRIHPSGWLILQGTRQRCVNIFTFSQEHC